MGLGMVFTRKSHKRVQFDKFQGLLQFSTIKPIRNILNERANKSQKGAEILSEPRILESDLDFILDFLGWQMHHGVSLGNNSSSYCDLTVIIYLIPMLHLLEYFNSTLAMKT